jgi:hypothetical protein
MASEEEHPRFRRLPYSEARQYKQANPSATPEDLEQNLPDGDVWTTKGIKKQRRLCW